MVLHLHSEGKICENKLLIFKYFGSKLAHHLRKTWTEVCKNRAQLFYNCWASDFLRAALFGEAISRTEESIALKKAGSSPCSPNRNKLEEFPRTGNKQDQKTQRTRLSAVQRLLFNNLPWLHRQTEVPPLTSSLNLTWPSVCICHFCLLWGGEQFTSKIL